MIQLSKSRRVLSGRIASPRLLCRSRYEIEPLEGRWLLSVSIANDYTGIDFNGSGGYVPPDTCGAVGPTSYVETVNQAVRLFTAKTSSAGALSSSLSNFYFTTGGLTRADSGSGLSDPIVTYDEHIGRFIVGDQDVNFSTHVSKFDIAVSKTSSPTSLSKTDWNFYSIVTTDTSNGGYDADYPGNFGYNHDAFVFTLNMFPVLGTSPYKTQVVSVNTADLAAGAASPAVFKNFVNDFSLRPTTMHDSVAGDPMWLVTEHGNNTSIDVVKMGNVLTNSASFTYTNLAVTGYSSIVTPKNPNGTTITGNIDSRIQKAAESNNTLVATHSVGASSTQDVVQWYKVNVGGATPTLADQGRISAGNNTYLVYPGIDINPSGSIGVSYMQSGTDTATDYLSTWVTARASGDAAGTMQTPVRSAAGTGLANYTDFASGHRAGDLSGISIDPVNGSFWAANEYANTQATANWGTAIVNFDISGQVLQATDMSAGSSGPSSITAGTNATYTISLTNNGSVVAQGVVLTDTLPTGSSFVSCVQATGADAFTITQSNGKVTITANGNIAAGSSDTFTLIVSAPSNLANGAAFNNTAAVTASNPDGNSANNTATTNGTIVNASTNADVSVSVSGPATGNEGSNATYTITVTNNGPAGATGVSLADTLGSLLSYVSATTTQGSFSQLNGVVTFNIGAMTSGQVVTATVTALAIEDGSTSNTASITTTNPDPTLSNNSSSQTTIFSEPPITVSGSIRIRTSSLSNYQVATFTHANGLELPSDFNATINWGDGTSSAGTITKSGTTYYVKGSHTYARRSRYTIKTTVSEVGLAVDKLGDEGDPKDWKRQDVVKLPGNSAGRLASNTSIAATASTSTGWITVSTLDDDKNVLTGKWALV